MSQASIKVYGTWWCWDCRRAKKILNEYHIAYQWIDIEKDANAKKFVGSVNYGSFVVPTIIFDDGSILSEPSNSELKNRIEQEIKSRDV